MVLKEAGAVLTESEKPLGYAATVVTILGVAAVIAYLLTLIGIEDAEAVAFGFLSALLGLAVFYLAVSLRRGSRSAGILEAAQKEKASHQAAVAQLEAQVVAVQRAAAEEKSRLEADLSARNTRIATLTDELTEARRIAEAERQSTERAKVAPAMDPLYRFEGHLIRKDHYWIGVENKGLGPAENVTISPRFKSASDEWSLVTDPYISVLQKGEKQEFELAAKHFDRKPTEMVVTVAYDDLTGTHHSKSVRFTFD